MANVPTPASSAAADRLGHRLQDAPLPPLAEGRPVESIQPGGGLCFDLELAWGQLRRRFLRRFRPAYVARLLARRQGACEGCPHDIIDARDLKPFRNVCGHWFREEDDPFRWRGRLFLARAGLAEVAVATAACLAAGLPLAGWALATGGVGPWAAVGLIALLWFQLVWFFRDPERTPPDDPAALVSPADGVVTHLDEVDAPGFPGGRAFRVSIYLSPFDVHLNRAPRRARVVSMRYFPGAFMNARRPESAVRNEQLWTDFVEPNGRPLRVKQISGALARRLVCWAKPGEALEVGERYGLIKYGSRTDVLLPLETRVEKVAKVGDRVSAGLTVLLRIDDGGTSHGAAK